MSNNIVKEILLRFKGDSRPLEREIKNVEKVASNLQKTISGGTSSGPSQFSKTLDGYIKQSNKFGSSLTKDMTKFQKTMQEVATKDLRQLQRQTDDLFRKTEDRLRKLRTAEQNVQRLSEQGASPSRIQKQQRRAMRYGAEYSAASKEFEYSADAYNERAAQVPPESAQRYRAAKRINTAGGIIDTATIALETYNRMQIAREESKAVLNETMKQRRMDYYNGNLSEMMLERKDNITTRSAQFAAGQRARKNWTSAGAIAGGALAIGGAILAPVSGGTSLAMTAAGIGMMGYGAIDLAGRRGDEEKMRLEQANRLRKSTMTDEYYRYLSERAPVRYEMQRQMRMNEGEAQNYRIQGRNNLFSEDQSTSTLMALRGSLGNKAGVSVATQAMELARQQGMGLQTATMLSGQYAMSGSGGAGGTKKALTDIYSDAFSKGIVDSGLIETLQKGVGDVAARSPDVMDLAGIAARLTENIRDTTGGREPTARDITGALNAQNLSDQISMQGGESGFTKMSSLSDVFKGDTGAMAFFSNRSDTEIESLIRTGDPRAKHYLDKAGVSVGDALDALGSDATATKKMSTTQMGQSTLNEIKSRLKKGENYQDVIGAMSGDVGTVAGIGSQSLETSKDLTDRMLRRMAKNDPELNKLLVGVTASAQQNSDPRIMAAVKKQASDAGMNRAEEMQKATMAGQTDMDIASSGAISAHGIRETARMTKSAGAVGPMGVDASVTQLKAALDAFAKSLDDQGRSASSSATGTGG